MYDDIRYRRVSHCYLWWLALLMLALWVVKQPNWAILPYSLSLLIVGFFLFRFGILGAGDTKLLVVLSLAIRPQYISLTLVFIAILGGLIAFLYLLYGLMTDITAVRQRGIPYAIPICVVSGFAIYLSSL